MEQGLPIIEALHGFLLLSAPYLVLGFTVSALVHCFLPMSLVKRLMGRNRLGDVTWASIVGVPLPLCSCSVIPTAVTLKKAGASNGGVASFLISTPETGVDSISLTYALIDLPMTIIRPIAAFCSAWVGGALNFFFNADGGEPVKDESSCCHSKKSHESAVTLSLGQRLKQSFRYSFFDLLDDMAGALSLGLILGAMIFYFVPGDFFHHLDGAMLKFAMFFVGIPLYICASATTPIAASLILKGMSPGTALVLLMVGPATNISNLIIIRQYLGTKGVLLNLLAVVMVALAFSFGMDWLYFHYFNEVSAVKLGHQHGAEHHAWWEYLSAWLMVVLILLSLLRTKVIPRIKKK